MKNFYRSITDSLSQTSASLEEGASKLIPITDDYWLGEQLGEWSDWAILDEVMNPEEVSAWFKGKMKDNLGFHRTERATRMLRPEQITQTVTILPTSNGGAEKKNMFDMLAEDGFESITNAKPTFGSKQTLTSPYEQSQGQEEILSADQLIAPFSKYTPTILWPFTTSEGNRYTVHDLGEESLSFPGKGFAEYALGKELDQVGALPGFNQWGDSLLGAGPVVIGGGTVLLLGLTAPVWAPAISQTAIRLTKTTLIKGRQITSATKNGLIKVAKAFAFGGSNAAQLDAIKKIYAADGFYPFK
jgi:hypothetical protein